MANDTAKRLLARIRALREARGLTRETFAERAGLTYKHYQQVEAAAVVSRVIVVADTSVLKSEAGFWFSTAVQTRILELAGETGPAS